MRGTLELIFQKFRVSYDFSKLIILENRNVHGSIICELQSKLFILYVARVDHEVFAVKTINSHRRCPFPNDETLETNCVSYYLKSTLFYTYIDAKVTRNWMIN